MEDNSQRYLAFVDDFEKHIQDMAHSDGRSSSYATEAEIFATCHVYDIDVYVYKAENKNFEWQRFASEDKC